jgi:hypothetical protein
MVIVDRLISWLNRRDAEALDAEMLREPRRVLPTFDEHAAREAGVTDEMLAGAARYWREVDIAESDSDDDELSALRRERADVLDTDAGNAGDESQLDEPQ